MSVRALTRDDVDIFRELRLFGMKESPSAFGSSYEETRDLPREVQAKRLDGASAQDRAFGGFLETVSGSSEQQPDQELNGLVAIGGLHREQYLKGKHKVMIWGMYVHPEHRGQGWGRKMMEALLAEVRTWEGVVQVNLSVESSNVPAKRLYESLGFVKYGSEPRSLLVDGLYYDEDSMLLRLD